MQEEGGLLVVEPDEIGDRGMARIGCIVVGRLAVFLGQIYTFEVGGKKKKQLQLHDVEDGYVVKDDIETGYGNIIPLWMFGMLY